MAGYVWVAVCHDQVTNVQFWPGTVSRKLHALLDLARRRSAARDPELPFKGGGCNDSI